VTLSVRSILHTPGLCSSAGPGGPNLQISLDADVFPPRNTAPMFATTPCHFVQFKHEGVKMQYISSMWECVAQTRRVPWPPARYAQTQDEIMRKRTAGNT
jgi:hypothetical protein